MNYEKKYKEALERARKLKENPQSVFNEYSPKEGDTICDYIFPELKESEDERIRKELITHCRNTRCVTEEGAERIAKWIDWIEKQGEHANFLSKIQVGDKVTRNEAGVLVNLSQLRRVAKPRKKQCEQEPAWSEEDKETLDRIISNYQYFCDELFFKEEWIEVEKQAIKNVDKEDIDWLKSLKEKIKGE